MQCLNCRETLVAIEFDRLEIDYCLSCFGIWLDSGELESIVGLNPPVTLVERDLPTSKSRRRCPVCNQKMSVVSARQSKDVELDCCPYGHGIWFDRGELSQIAELLGKPLRAALVEQLGAMFGTGKSGRISP